MPATNRPAHEGAGANGYPGDVPGIRGHVARTRYMLSDPGYRAHVLVATVCVVALFAVWLIFDWSDLINPFFVGVTAVYPLRLVARAMHRFPTFTSYNTARLDVVGLIGGLVANAIWSVLTYFWH